MATIASTLLAAPVQAQLGRGYSYMRFTSYSGPVASGFGSDFSQANWSTAGLINGQTVQATSAIPKDPSDPNGLNWYMGNVNFPNLTFGTFMTYQGNPFNSPRDNFISYTSYDFNDVGQNQPFTMGRINFQNGAWFGAGDDAAFNVPSIMNFTLYTFSYDNDPMFQQTIDGYIQMTVNSPSPNDLTTLGGMQAEADWISVFVKDPLTNQFTSLGSLRVYDNFAAPPGFSNYGSIDITGFFASLHVTGLTNPVGGFYTAGNGPLPPVVPGGGGGGAVPEPASWAMLIAGFGLVGAMARRRRHHLLA